MENNINHPSHYNQGSIECIEAMKAMSTKEQFYGFLKLNAFKYLWRSDNKGKTLEDLKKAVWYINKLISEMEQNNDNA